MSEGICRHEFVFAGIINELEDLMFEVIDDIIDTDGDLENQDNPLQELLTMITETYAVHEKDIIIGE